MFGLVVFVFVCVLLHIKYVLFAVCATAQFSVFLLCSFGKLLFVVAFPFCRISVLCCAFVEKLFIVVVFPFDYDVCIFILQTIARSFVSLFFL